MDIGGQQDWQSTTFKRVSLPESRYAGKQFAGCIFEHCQFRDTAFQDCIFDECSFKECDLSLMKVNGSQFRGAKFSGCQLLGVNWAEAHWPSVSLHEQITFTGCALNYATFFGIDLEKVVMRDCAAKEVDFSEAKLVSADCRGTDFAGSRFLHTDLTDADFRGALNYTIHAGQNTLKRTKFSLPEAMSLLYSLEILLEE